MSYLIYEDGELLDVMNFGSEEEVNAYIEANPTHTVEFEEDFVDFEDESETFDDDLDF